MDGEGDDLPRPSWLSPAATPPSFSNNFLPTDLEEVALNLHPSSSTSTRPAGRAQPPPSPCLLLYAHADSRYFCILFYAYKVFEENPCKLQMSMEYMMCQIPIALLERRTCYLLLLRMSS